MNQVIEILIEQWRYDIQVMSQPWMYWTVLPIVFYITFFFVKWSVLTAPAWLPFYIVINGLKK